MMIDKLWGTFDRASWVCPQVAATLSIIDEDFIEHALKRLLNGVLILEPSKAMVDFYKSEEIENPKGFMSLWGLLEKIYRCGELEIEELLDLKERLEQKDSDNSSAIALSWRKEVVAILNS